jgi:hypothetical protein
VSTAPESDTDPLAIDRPTPPKAMNKFEHGEKVVEAQKRIAVPRRQLAS